jgi:hypothetical protein
MTPEAEIRRANQAQMILDDPLVKGALEELRARVISQFRDCPVENDGLRYRLQVMLNMIDHFERLLREHIETGHFAAAQLGMES